MSFLALIVAAGSGSRSGGKKQFWMLHDRPVWRWSYDAFVAAKAADLVLVIAEEDRAEFEQTARTLPISPRLVIGGKDRSQSVQNGLHELAKWHELSVPVLIHDAARPLLTPVHITSLLEVMTGHDGAILALPVTDSLKRGDDATLLESVSRDGLYRAQTPQGFRLGDILKAYETDQAATPTDESEIAQKAGLKVALVAGDRRLEKLTYAEDLDHLAALSMTESTMKHIRVGQGFDAHRWGDGQSVWLCGVEIAHSKTLIGHSDADAGLHALTDAILGAAGLGDIGDHFPPTDPQWKGASSDIFLEHAAKLVRDRGGEIINIDVTLICEQPKIKPHREAMRQRVSEIINIDISRVSLKATTTEKMGFTGREEGLAAQAVCLIEMPVN